MAIKFSDVFADNGPLKGLYISEKNAKASREMFDDAGYKAVAKYISPDTKISKNATDPDPVGGEYLDRLGELWGAFRCTDETDRTFRARVHRTININLRQHRQTIGGMQDAAIERQTMDAPMIKSGPHMFNELCHCESCAGWRAQRDAGLHIDINTVRQEAELTRLMARDEWELGFFRGTQDDPVMSIPCSVVLALCERGDHSNMARKLAESFTECGNLKRENRRLMDEVDGLREKPTIVHPADAPAKKCRSTNCNRRDNIGGPSCSGCELLYQ